MVRRTIAKREGALHYLGFYIQLLRHSDQAPVPQSLEDVLAAMQFAIDLTDAEYLAVCERARTELAGRFPDNDG